jgi:REP element-mobilizing transposase RayT
VHKKANPVHLTMRARPGVRSLRHGRVFPAVREAIKAATKGSFRVVHFSVQSDHLHLIVEAADTSCLSSGVRGLAIRAARAINRALGRKGSVWGDRYHTRALASPREVRNGLVYVLMNFRKHLRPHPGASPIDPCSSAPWFDGFRGRDGTARDPSRRDGQPTSAPATWLARRGWRRRGLIGLAERPG